jgi:hypothetical protein
MLPVRNAIATILTCFFVVGCSGEVNAPPLGTVTGKVTLDGKSVTNVTVNFESANGQIAFGNTDPSGIYELKFRSGLKGAEVGMNKVRIETVLDAPAPAGYKDPIPAKYNSRSTLQMSVQPGKNTHDFELTSK